jgi:hypothetical protein
MGVPVSNCSALAYYPSPRLAGHNIAPKLRQNRFKYSATRWATGNEGPAKVTHQWLLASLRSFQNGAIREHKELCYARREQRNESLKVLLEGIERGLVSTLTIIGSITEDRALSDVEKVTRIRALLATRESRRLLEKDPIVELKASLASELGEDDYYKILESKSVWIQNRVNPVLKALTFQAGPSVRKLVDAVEHFKEKDGAVDKSAPAGFLDPEEGAAVQKEGKFRVSLYKALLFLHVQSGIKSGALNLEHSYKCRPLDDYLIDRVRWQRDKQHLIRVPGSKPWSTRARC